MFNQAHQGPNTHHNQPRILYFISRNNGTIVPLVPADELPFNIRLADVPRVMTFDQTCGMQHVGTAPYTGLTFKLEHGTSTMMHRSSSNPDPSHSRSTGFTTNRFRAPDALALQALATPSATGEPMFPLPQRRVSAHELASSWRKAPTSQPVDKTQDVIDAIVSTQSGAETAARIGYQSRTNVIQAPSGNIPDPDKKEYCTYWLRTGECAFTQQGCLYKHEMPATLEKLQELGFRRWPEWWQKVHQQVRLDAGGDRMMTAPAVKPAVWLKHRKASESSSDGDESESGDEQAVQKDEIKNVTKPASGKGTGNDSSCFSNVQQIEGKSRQQSLVGDLISFSAPPDRPSSGASASTSPVSTTATPTSASSSDTTNEAQSTSHKVFVPAGESAEVHIAEAKKPEKTTNRSRNGDLPYDHQLVSMQKKKHNTGLMASKHATTNAGTTGEQAQDTPRGLRPRVPKPRARAARVGGDGGKGTTQESGDKGGQSKI